MKFNIPLRDAEGLQRRWLAEASLLVPKVLMDLSEPEAGEERDAFFDYWAHYAMPRVRLPVIRCYRNRRCVGSVRILRRIYAGQKS